MTLQQYANKMKRDAIRSNPIDTGELKKRYNKCFCPACCIR